MGVKKSALIADLNQFYEQYYVESLRNAGFVSQGDNLIDWYRIENDILYGVHLSMQGTLSFMCQEIYISVLPLFIWNEIPPGIPINDYYWGNTFCNRCIFINAGDLGSLLPLYESRIGPMKRESYRVPGLILGLPCGCRFVTLNSERRGAEALEEVAFPLMSSLKSVEDIYRFHLELLYRYNKTDSVDQYIELIQEQKRKYSLVTVFSNVLADECVAVRDEKLYPYMIAGLKYAVEHCEKSLTSPASKSSIRFLKQEGERAAFLLRVMEEKNYDLWEQNIVEERKKMIKQIQKKLPQLKIPT